MTYDRVVNSGKEWEEMTAQERKVISDHELGIYAPRLKELKKSGKYSVKELNIFVLDLWEDCKICEDTEMALYEIADPDEECNDVWQAYWDFEGKNPLDVVA